MRALLPALLVLLPACSLGPRPVASAPVPEVQRGRYAEDLYGGQFNALVGLRGMEDAQWEPVDQQFNFGVNFVAGPRDAILNWDIMLHYATESSQVSTVRELETESVEGSVGLIHFFRFGGDNVLLPYAGAGVSMIYTDAELVNSFNEDSDWAFGGYLRGGLLIRFRRHDHIGVDLRYLTTSDMTLGGVETDANTFVFSLVFGNQF